MRLMKPERGRAREEEYPRELEPPTLLPPRAPKKEEEEARA